MAVVAAATKTTAAAAGGGAFPSSKLRNSNEISGKVNILCVNQIPTSIREDPWHGAAKFNSNVTLGALFMVVRRSLLYLLSLFFVEYLLPLCIPLSLSLLF